MTGIGRQMDKGRQTDIGRQGGKRKKKTWWVSEMASCSRQHCKVRAGRNRNGYLDQKEKQEDPGSL